MIEKAKRERVNKLSLKLPIVGSKVLASGKPVEYVLSRIKECLKMYADEKMTVSGIYVYCDNILAEHCRSIVEVENVKVWFRGQSSQERESNGVLSFHVYLSSGKRDARLDIPGIAYDTPITEAIWETRWRLEVIDGLDPKESEIAARLL